MTTKTFYQSMAEILAQTALCHGSTPSLPAVAIDVVLHGGQILPVVSHIVPGQGTVLPEISILPFCSFISDDSLSSQSGTPP